MQPADFNKIILPGLSEIAICHIQNWVHYLLPFHLLPNLFRESGVYNKLQSLSQLNAIQAQNQHKTILQSQISNSEKKQKKKKQSLNCYDFGNAFPHL